MIAESPSSFEEKIVPLIAGMHLHAFIAMLAIGEKNVTTLLKNYTQTEPFQHKLVLATSELAKGVDSLRVEADRFLKDAVSNPKQTLIAFEESVRLLQGHAKSLEETIQHFLEFVWDTEKSDLILRMSEVKEQLLHLKQHLSQFPSLFKEMKAQIFKSPDDASGVAALADLGWVYGDELDQLALKLGWQKNGKAHSEATAFLEKFLSDKGLTSVKAFKDRGITSKEALLAFLR